MKADVVRISAERMHEPEMLTHAMDSFTAIVNHRGSGGGDMNHSIDEILRLQKLWLAFVGEHFDEIQAGKLFDIGDPLLKPELFAGV